MSAFLNKALVQGKVKMTSPSTPPTHLPWNQIEISTHCVAGETWGWAVISWTTAWLVNWTSIWLLTLSIRWSGLVLITSTVKWTFIMQRTRNFALLYHLHLTWGILYNLILDMLMTVQMIQVMCKNPPNINWWMVTTNICKRVMAELTLLFLFFTELKIHISKKLLTLLAIPSPYSNIQTFNNWVFNIKYKIAW